MASHFPGASLLDPSCGIGVLIKAVAEATDAEIVHGVEAVDPESAEIARAYLGDVATVFEGSLSMDIEGLREHYDLIVSIPPRGLVLDIAPTLEYPNESPRDERLKRVQDILFGHAQSSGDGFRLSRLHLDHYQTVSSCRRLSDNGLALTAVGGDYPHIAGSRQIQQAINAQGCAIRALISFPNRGFYHGRLRTSKYLVVVEKGKQEQVFVGQYSADKAHQSQLIANFKKRQAGRSPELGRLVTLESFKGFEALETTERLENLVRKTGWKGIPASEVILDWEKALSIRGTLVDGSSSCYLGGETFDIASTDPIFSRKRKSPQDGSIGCLWNV